MGPSRGHRRDRWLGLLRRSDPGVRGHASSRRRCRPERRRPHHQQRHDRNRWRRRRGPVGLLELGDEQRAARAERHAHEHAELPARRGGAGRSGSDCIARGRRDPATQFPADHRSGRERNAGDHRGREPTGVRTVRGREPGSDARRVRARPRRRHGSCRPDHRDRVLRLCRRPGRPEPTVSSSTSS